MRAHAKSAFESERHREAIEGLKMTFSEDMLLSSPRLLSHCSSRCRSKSQDQGHVSIGMRGLLVQCYSGSTYSSPARGLFCNWAEFKGGSASSKKLVGRAWYSDVTSF